jgi:hypothetical protein
MVTCDITRATVRDQLAFVEVDDFRYFSTYHHLRRKHPTGFCYLTIHVTSSAPGSASLGFYLAVQITEVERTKKALLGSSSKIGHYDRTIWCYSVNFGPGSPHWDFPIRGYWSFSSEDEIWAARPEIESFTRDLSLPYISRHVDPLEIRRTLLETKGRALNFHPYQDILTIGFLYCAREVLEEDIERLRERYVAMPPDFCRDFESFASVIRKA